MSDDGQLWICTAAGTPGTWVGAGDPRFGVADASTVEVVGGVLREKDAGTTNAKLAPMAARTVKMRHTNSTGAPEDTTMTNLLSDIGEGIIAVDNGGSVANNNTAQSLLGAPPLVIPPGNVNDAYRLRMTGTVLNFTGASFTVTLAFTWGGVSLWTPYAYTITASAGVGWFLDMSWRVGAVAAATAVGIGVNFATSDPAASSALTPPTAANQRVGVIAPSVDTSAAINFTATSQCSVALGTAISACSGAWITRDRKSF